MSDQPNPATVQTNNPAPGTPEHDAAMAAHFDAAQNSGKPDGIPVESTEKPDWLPEKFMKDGKPDYEALAKSYAELEKKGSGQQQQQTQPPSEQSTTQEVKDGLAAQGLDYSAFETEFLSTGELSAESYDKLTKAGIPKEMVDSYLAGQSALAGEIQREVYDTVGGSQQYAEMVKWASTNLSAGEIEAFNRAMDAGTVDDIKLAVGGLQARYSTANGKEPNLINGHTGAVTGESFRSTAELTEAMRDPRYRTDPAYRADVAAKLARSNIM